MSTKMHRMLFYCTIACYNYATIAKGTSSTPEACKLTSSDSYSVRHSTLDTDLAKKG